MNVLTRSPNGTTAHSRDQRALCLVPRGHAKDPDAARTVHVPAPALGPIIERTASYRGPCASYGESAPRGNGSLTAYSQTHDGVPHAIGVVLPSGTLDGLPYDPPTAGLWCYDKDGNGTIHPMRECSGGYENAVHLGSEFRREVDSLFTYLLVNWNPRGHIPLGVYDVPHFDVHFYLNANAERLAIDPGPCPALVSCTDYERGKDLPDPRYRADDYVDRDALEPAMGNHLIDLTAPEFHGASFTHTFIYGVWDDEVTFYEPMVTHEWLRGLVDGTRADSCAPMKLPRAWQRPGWYPTEYCLRYRANRDELTVSLESFVHRAAS